MLRTQLPEDWIDVTSTAARSAIASGASASLIQLYWMFWRVVKCPKPRSYLRATCANWRICRDALRDELLVELIVPIHALFLGVLPNPGGSLLPAIAGSRGDAGQRRRASVGQIRSDRRPECPDRLTDLGRPHSPILHRDLNQERIDDLAARLELLRDCEQPLRLGVVVDHDAPADRGGPCLALIQEHDRTVDQAVRDDHLRHRAVRTGSRKGPF